MLIRTLNKSNSAELAKVFEVQVRSYRVEAALLGVTSLPPLEETLEDLKESSDEAYVAVKQNAVVGALFLEKSKTEVLISKLIVDPHFFARESERVFWHIPSVAILN